MTLASIGVAQRGRGYASFLITGGSNPGQGFFGKIVFFFSTLFWVGVRLRPARVGGLGLAEGAKVIFLIFIIVPPEMNRETNFPFHLSGGSIHAVL